MKTLTLTTLLFLALFSYAQSQPAGFTYQSVVRNAQGQPLADQAITMRLTVREGAAQGTSVYQEVHNAQSNSFGLVNLVVGEGTGSDNLENVSWGTNSHYLQVEVDPDGGNNYTDMGTSQLLSVPYARHAETASNVDDADADPTNELQNLSLSGNSLSISNGNAVNLPEVPDFEEDAMAKAWVNFPIFGQPNLAFDAYNITSTSVVTTGVRVVSFPSGLFATATNPAFVCQIRNDLAPGFCTVVSGASPSQATVRTFNASGNPEDKEFSLVVFGK